MKKKDWYWWLLLMVGSPLWLQAQAWTITPRAPMPEPVTNQAVIEAWVGNQPYVYSFGGLDTTKRYSGIHRRAYRYDPLANVWDTLPPLPDTLGKIAPAGSRVKDKLYLIGGYHVFANGNERSSDRVHIFDPATNQYLPDGAPIPIPIDDQVQVVWRDSLIYVITGWSNTGNISRVQIYNPSTDTWGSGTGVPSNSIYPSFGASGAIVGDTIYYFGGASMSGSFRVQFHIRRGVINPANPSQITWSNFLWSNVRGYRMAAVEALDRVFWIGGSDVTYNYNGIAYNGTGGVSPNGRILSYQPSTNQWRQELGYPLPMDLRGLGRLNDTTFYLLGGMLGGQQVSDQTLLLQLNTDSIRYTSVQQWPPALPALQVQLYPNPASSSSTVQLRLSKAAPAQYQLFTRTGVLLRAGPCAGLETRLSLADLVPGWYRVEVQQGQERGGVWLQVGE